MKSPYPYFGGKSRVAPLVWARFGEVRNYVEPFLGSAAMLLARPGGAQGIETVNDACGYVANFWRALQAEPEQVAAWADQPVNENDLHARHHWLRARDMRARLEGDPYWYDAQAAGWWVWGMACWIGGGWCGPQGAGPWVVRDGEMVRGEDGGGGEAGVRRTRVDLGSAGRGVACIRIQQEIGVLEYMQQLRDRMRRVRVACGDWSRVCGSVATVHHGLSAVFLDPPYCSEDRLDCYAQESYSVAHDVMAWCAEMGKREDMRIALCGYDGEHNVLEEMGWEVVAWKASGGISHSGTRGSANAWRERIWFSPACVRPDAQGTLWEEAT